MTEQRNNNAKILVVDDEEKVLKFLSALLSSHRYVLETAQNGIEAIQKAEKTNPDIIILDILMPEMDGLEACKRLKTNPKTRHIPIIVLTSVEDKETKLQCLEAGANDFLSKPIDNIELIARIKNFLQLKNLEGIKKNNEILMKTIKAIEIAKREWEQTLDCISDIVILSDENDAIKRCNKAMKEFVGKPYEEIIGRNWRELLLEHDLKIEAVYGQGTDLFHKPTGRWFMFNLYPVKNSSDSGTVILIKDFTELKMTTEELEITNVAINKERTDLQFALNEITFLLHEVEEKKDLSVRFTATHVSESDVIYRISSNFNNMMDMLESQHKELQKAYAELKAAQSRILQQEKMASIGQLAAGIAHEINNPVGFVMSNLGSLQKYADKLSEFIKIQTEAFEELSCNPPIPPSEKGGEVGFDNIIDKVKETRKSLKVDYIVDDLGNLIKESLEGAERVKKIVQNLKSFSHIDEAEWKMADINAGIESTINIVWNELKYKVTMKKEYGDIPMTKCNPGQINQVFMNILINAAHAIEKQGELSIKTWHDAGYIFISISDTGCGISADKINRIFEPFFTTKEVGKGTGLGLSIAYDIVKKHNGDIMVESEVGKGTTFTVKIPVVEK